MSADRIFVDANVLVYAHDLDAGSPPRSWPSYTLTRKIRHPLAPPLAREVVGGYGAWEIEPIDVSRALRAAEVEERHGVSFWDALIVVAASREDPLRGPERGPAHRGRSDRESIRRGSGLTFAAASLRPPADVVNPPRAPGCRLRAAGPRPRRPRARCHYGGARLTGRPPPAR